MSRVRIRKGDLHSGTGVEGRRKKRRNKDPVPREEIEKESMKDQSCRGRRPVFEDAESDIFYSGKG